MKKIDIAKTLVNKRIERGITQEELATFIGVSKASVSKWEKRLCYPDITYLPQLASYFNISLDELMGYEPQMTDDDIRKLNGVLLKEFSTKPLDETLDYCRGLVKKHYSCFPLLFQIGLLFLNYASASKDEESKNSIIVEAKGLFARVKTLSDNIELKQLALQSEAMCEMMLENPHEVISLLESERKYSFQPSIEALLSQSYQMLGEIKEAKLILEESLLDNIILFFYDLTLYLTLYTDNADHFEEACQRAIGLAELFRLKEVFPAIVLPFYLTAAEGYLAIENTERAFTMLEAYVEIATGDIFPLILREDTFFSLIKEIQEDPQKKRPLKMPELPCDEQSIRQDMITAVVDNPTFSKFQENQRFKSLTSTLQKML